jgi:gamma-glutamyltranspeptidase/glutathione hydrolase
LIESIAAENVLSGIGSELDFSESPGDTDDGGDTVYLTVVDQWGNAVSWIQSLFGSFGSGLLEPETGVVLQNRGALFTLDQGHPNVVAPGKRPYHTLTPTMGLNPDGSFSFALGTPGGDSQVQSLVQILNNLFMFGMTPQEAIEAPRFRSYQDLRVAFEDRFPAYILQGLMDQGHIPNVVNGWTATFGGAQMILLEGSGTLTAAADPRREAYALAY